MSDCRKVTEQGNVTKGGRKAEFRMDPFLPTAYWNAESFVSYTETCKVFCLM